MRLNREQRRQLERDNAKFGRDLKELHPDTWPQQMPGERRLRVWRSRDFLVQEFEESGPATVRLSVNRTRWNTLAERWNENISWDDLQWIKNQCGYGHLDAVEVYPPEADIVNVANMRHLWVLREPLAFAWRPRKAAPPPRETP